MNRQGNRMLALMVLSLLIYAPTIRADDVFRACSNNSTEKIRSSSVFVNDTPRCSSKETLRSWTTAAGPAGPPGPSDAYSTSIQIGDPRAPIAVPSSGITVGSLSLPPGNYVASASLYFTNDSADPGIALCLLAVNDRNVQSADSEDGEHAISQALTVAAQLPAGGTATLICRNNGASGNLAIQTFSLNAIRVGSLTIQ
jgi:hypothetical protein